MRKNSKRPYQPSRSIVEMEWAQLNERQVVVATPDEMWIHELNHEHGSDPFAEPMTGPGSDATTRQLLDAAWCAGLNAVADSLEPVRQKTLNDYIWELIGYYHLTSTSVHTLTNAAERFREAGRADLELFARRFARLEAGDEAMAVADLQALGYNADGLVRHCPPPPNATTYSEYWSSLVRSAEPITAFGYLYAGERSSLALTRDDLRLYEQMMPQGVSAISCRWHHSGVGGDVAHVKFFIRSASRLPATDRARIARAVYDATMFLTSVPIPVAENRALLERFAAFHVSAMATNSP